MMRPSVAKQCFLTGVFVEEQVLAMARSTLLPEAMCREKLLEGLQTIVVRVGSEIIASQGGVT